MKNLAAQLLDRVLAPADVRLDGGRAHDPRVVNPRLYRRVLIRGTLGAGEAYVDGDWECDALDELAARILRAGADRRMGVRWAELRSEIVARLANRQHRERAAENGSVPYAAGNDLYRAMLGPSLVYSCGYWRDAADLEAAQEAKLDLICRKLRLEAGHSVLDIGCGWGSFARFAAERYGARVVGVTVAPAQVDVARELCVGLPVEIRLEDYRDVRGCFDRVVSIGMFEHVGPRNYGDFFDVARRCLARDGLFLLHTIGGLRSLHIMEPWIATYMFPHAVLPSAQQIARALEGRFVIEDWHSFGVDYDRTLREWAANLEAAWPSLGPGYDERARRTWRYYLLTCAGSFRARQNQLWQLVLSPRGVDGGYVSIR